MAGTLMPSDGCSARIAWSPPGTRREAPVRLEVVTDDGECFSLVFARGAWTKLLNTGCDVEARIEPLETREELG